MRARSVRARSVRGRWVSVLAVTALTLVGLAACGNEESGSAESAEAECDTRDEGRPGVTDTEIRVGGVIGRTNPVGQPYEDSLEGVNAYFDQVNAQGGIYGRQLALVSERDDQSRASQNIAQIRALIEEDNVFAVLPITTQIFAGADELVEACVPAFGWNINAEWSNGPNLFGEKGSYLCFDCPGTYLPFLAQSVGAERVGIMSYTAQQSGECAKGQRNSYDKYGFDVVFEDTSLSFGFTDLSADIAQIRDSGVQFISTCMDVDGNIKLSEALKQNGLDDVVIYSPQGYDPAVPAEFGDKVEGFYFGSAFVPFEVEDPPEGMQQFLAAMTERGQDANELALAGWINARLFVEGLRMAGEDFTQGSVIDEISTLDNWTADGILGGVDYTEFPRGPGLESCNAYIQVQNGQFVPVLGQPGQPFVCFPERDLPDTVDSPTYR